LIKLAVLPLIGALAGLSAALLATSLITPTYRATASVIVKPVAKKKGSGVNDVSLALNLAPSVARLAESREVANATAKRLGVRRIAGTITANSEPGNQIVTLQVEGQNRQSVAAIANAATRATGVLFAVLRPSGTSDIVVEALDDATVPTTPIAPRPLLNNTLGVTVGLLIGIGVGSLLGRSEDRFRRVVDVERDLALPALATIRRLPIAFGGNAYRFYRRAANRAAVDRLLSALSILGSGDAGRRIVITSVGDDRMTPFMAALLAIGLTRYGQRVAVVEGQRRARGIARFTRGHGVRTVGHTLTEPAKITIGAEHEPTVLPIDEITEYFTQPPRPEQLGALVDALADSATDVVITAPPVLAGPGITALAEHADVVILVVASNRASRAEAGRAALLIRKLGVGLAGAVITGAATDEDGWRPAAWKDPALVDPMAERAVLAGARRAAVLASKEEPAAPAPERPRLHIATP
jgi:capsular polysaccharide biosynthesis protein/Mrp family chromosome partitioning ATPase